MRWWQRLAGWCWDNLPGGVPTQNRVWNACPPVGEWCNAAADARDAEQRAARWTEDQL